VTEKPGTIAADWENRVIYICTYLTGTWLNTRTGELEACGDEAIAERCELIRPVP
jgi:hypothetical protein